MSLSLKSRSQAHGNLIHVGSHEAMPYQQEEISKTVDSMTIRYRLSACGRELFNLGRIAQEMLEMENRNFQFEVDLTNCGWLPRMDRNFMEAPKGRAQYGFTYITIPPSVKQLLAKMDNGEINVRFLMGKDRLWQEQDAAPNPWVFDAKDLVVSAKPEKTARSLLRQK
jgi:hypothetical protein